MIRWMTTTAILLAISTAGLAQDGGTGEEFDLAEAMRKIHRLLGKAEEELLETANRQKAAETGREAVEEIEKLLKGHEQTGKDIVDKINELLDNLPRMQGGGGGSSEQKPDQEQQPKDQEQSEVGDRDPENSRKGEPKGRDDKEQEPRQDQADKPPPDEEKEKTELDLSREWLDNLPPQLRMDVLNGNFERVPEKYRALIEAWTKKMARIDDDR